MAPQDSEMTGLADAGDIRVSCVICGSSSLVPPADAATAWCENRAVHRKRGRPGPARMIEMGSSPEGR